MNKEYIEREAVQKIIDYIRDKYCTYYNRRCKTTQFWWDTIRYFEKRIRALPAADVVEVVRCKDCKYYAAMITDTVSGNMETAPWGICTQPWFDSDKYDVDENGYCSCGERKMDKEE